ncbi:S41 family peptidase [Paramagnetospirillum kuznetsovii]|uniref:S41 family peptidase n=1 Tax=Paramagnetospirillum kuznetsovii TaxID=2053833 RepID=A0A364NXG0_9PROT|nr:S41 family peptidase [Paramagnetospirillum kuznetsovii]RAU21752.1 S41 family peptidase [Paramagnetospirillum kuznetsovii]
MPSSPFSRLLPAVFTAAMLLALPRGAWAAGWDAVEADKTIAFGFAAIVERHLQPVTAASIALDGMRALAEIDPQLAVIVQGGVVRISTADSLVGEYPAPAAADSAGWARVTVAAITAARLSSEMIRAADDEALYQAVFEGALGKVDLYSRYASAKEAREHRASRNGFGGIGIKFDMIESEPRIIEVIEDTPAARGGLKTGDVILMIDGQSVRPLDRNGISALLRGAVASDVLLLVRRGGDPVQVTLRRSLIVPKTVTMSLVGGIAEFKIASFNQRTAYSLESLLKDAKTRLGPGLTGVILDLRGNPGGLLDKAVSVVDLFVDKGPIVSTKGRHPEADNAFDAHPGDMGEDLPVVVLVDGRSASAAEIVASALQDAGRAVVVGTNSYGKGTVQTVIGLPNDGEITLTWSRFHTPSGYALHGLGVLPVLCTGANPNAAAVIDGLLRGTQSAKLPETLAVWRQSGFDETALRIRLRDTCPPARRSEAKADLELAEKLLLNRAAFARALALSTPPRTLEARQSRPPDYDAGQH